MTRAEIELMLERLYRARAQGDLAGLCVLFAPDARFEIAGSAQSRPMLVRASGQNDLRAWLGLLIKTFRLSEPRIITQIIDGQDAAVHWSTVVHSRITGTRVPTQLIDLMHFQNGRIQSYLEFLGASSQLSTPET